MVVMKKFCLIVGISFIYLLAYADKTWNFTNWALNSGGYTASLTVVDELMLNNMTGTNTFGVIDGNVKTIDGIVFSKRFKMGGAGYTSSATLPVYRPTQRYMAFVVDGDADVTVSFTTATTGANRNCYITNGDSILGQAMESANTGTSVTAHYSGGSDTLFVFGDGAINIYQVKWTTPVPDAIKNASKVNLKKVENSIENPDNLSVEIYSILGIRYLTSKEASIDISSLPKGAYIARCQKGVLKFINY
jgi:hypothetical protein